MGHWANPSNLLVTFVLMCMVSFSVVGTQEHTLISSDDIHADDYKNGDYDYGDYDYGDYYNYGDYDDDDSSYDYNNNNDNDNGTHGYGYETEFPPFNFDFNGYDIYNPPPFNFDIPVFNNNVLEEGPRYDSTLEPLENFIDEDLTPFEVFLDPDCEMIYFENRNISLDDDVLKTVIEIPLWTSYPSITIITKENESLAVNISTVPSKRPMASRFHLKSEIIEIYPSPLVTINLLELIHNNSRIVPVMVKLENVIMPSGNCTNGLPFSRSNRKHILEEHKEFLILSTQEDGFFRKSGSAVDAYYICYKGGGDILMKSIYSGACGRIPTRVNHPLHLRVRFDPEVKVFEVGGTDWVGVFSSTYYYSFSPNLTFVYCLDTCPMTTELNTPSGNVTIESKASCDIVDPQGLAPLIVAVAILFFILMGMDAVAFVVQRLFFKHATEQDMENPQWHLNTKPIPHIWQIPPPLPDRPPPPMVDLESVLRRRVVEDDEKEEEEEEEEEEEDSD